MRITKLGNSLLLGSGVLFTTMVMAEAPPQQHTAAVSPEQPLLASDSHAAHKREHGGQFYQRTELENRWSWNPDGQGSFESELESRIGTDENKLFILAHLHKAESERTGYDISTLYSRTISEFWDLQAGARYRYLPEQPAEQEQVDAVLGLYGLAPYFFETEAYLYAGKDRQWSLGFKTERDILLTQQLIAQPYIEAELVLSDASPYAKKRGINNLELGLQTRYEINKRVMPFIQIAYSYEKGQKATAWQQQTASDQDWQYGLGLKLLF